MNLQDPRIAIIENVLMRNSKDYGGEVCVGSLRDVHKLAIEILRSILNQPEVPS